MQLVQKTVSQPWKLDFQVIMANIFANHFPNLFLRVQVWAGSWKENDLPARVLFEHFINRLTTMPGPSTIDMQRSS